MSCGGRTQPLAPCIAATSAAIRALVLGLAGREYGYADGKVAETPNDRARKPLFATSHWSEVWLGMALGGISRTSHEVKWEVDLRDQTKHHKPRELGWDPDRIKDLAEDAQAIADGIFDAIRAIDPECVPLKFDGDDPPHFAAYTDSALQVIGVTLTFVLVY